MPRHIQPLTLKLICSREMTTDLITLCHSLQILICRNPFYNRFLRLTDLRKYLQQIPGSVRSELISETFTQCDSPMGLSIYEDVYPTILYMVKLLFSREIPSLKVRIFGDAEDCCHLDSFLKFLTVEGQGLKYLELETDDKFRIPCFLPKSCMFLYEALSSCTKLTHLKLQYISNDDVLMIIGSACPTLILLDVSRSFQVTDTGIVRLINADMDAECNKKAYGDILAKSPEENEPDYDDGYKTEEAEKSVILQEHKENWIQWYRRKLMEKRTNNSVVDSGDGKNFMCNSLREINIKYTKVTTKGVLLLLEHMTSLEALTGNDRIIEVLETYHIRTIQQNPQRKLRLKTFDTYSLSRRSVKILQILCPQLQKLQISYMTEQPSILKSLSVLSCLHICNIISTNSWMKDFYSYIKLEGHKLKELTLCCSARQAIDQLRLNLAWVANYCQKLCLLITNCLFVHWSNTFESSMETPFQHLSFVHLGSQVSEQAIVKLMTSALHLEAAHFTCCIDTCTHLVAKLNILSPDLNCFFVFNGETLGTFRDVADFLHKNKQVKSLGNLNWLLHTYEHSDIEKALGLGTNLDLQLLTERHCLDHKCIPNMCWDWI